MTQKDEQGRYNWVGLMIQLELCERSKFGHADKIS